MEKIVVMIEHGSAFARPLFCRWYKDEDTASMKCLAVGVGEKSNIGREGAQRNATGSQRAEPRVESCMYPQPVCRRV